LIDGTEVAVETAVLAQPYPHAHNAGTTEARRPMWRRFAGGSRMTNTALDAAGPGILAEGTAGPLEVSLLANSHYRQCEAADKS
jgi:hypothetical protein